jgi:quercetin dioxygenase-like cupin family protein
MTSAVLPTRNLPEAFPVKTEINLFVFALCGSLTAAAQIALPGCGCSVSSSAVSCSCPGAINKNTGESAKKQTVCGGHRELSEDWIVLSPGGALTRWVPGEDDLIVGEGEGTLTNEAKSPAIPIEVTAGLVLFIPNGDPYKLRNVGKQSIRITVIRMRPGEPPRVNRRPGLQ